MSSTIGFFHPRTKRDCRAMGGHSAFIVALFTEMSRAPPPRTWRPAGSTPSSNS